jgi:hypothetical protein
MAPPSTRPTLFVGSSSESLEVAYAAQKNLEDVAEVLVWKQGIFELTKSYLESLIDALDDTNFALFIFGAEDVTRIRGAEVRTTRDNVVFELGLFVGRLGRECTFIVAPQTLPEVHLPTDLLGITTATFQPPSRPDRMQAALGPACHDVRAAIRRHAARSTAAAAATVAQMEDVKALLPLLIPEAERGHLLNIARGHTKGYEGRGTLRAELRHLRSIGLLRKHTDRHIGDLKSGESHDLAEFVELTDLGRMWASRLAN